MTAPAEPVVFGKGGCVFCGGGPLSLEHVIPRWLGPRLGVGRITHAYEPPPGSEEASLEWSSDGVDLKVRRVCMSCNNGWLSRLEETVYLPLGAMVEGSSRKLSVDEARSVSRWALKTCVMVAAAEPGSPMSPAYAPEVLGSISDPSYFPPGVQVFGARLQEEGGVVVTTRGVQVKGTVVHTQAAFGILVLHWIALCVYVRRPGSGALPLVLTPRLAQAVVALGPPFFSDFWPPPTALSPDQLHVLPFMIEHEALGVPVGRGGLPG